MNASQRNQDNRTRWQRIGRFVQLCCHVTIVSGLAYFLWAIKPTGILIPLAIWIGICLLLRRGLAKK